MGVDREKLVQREIFLTELVKAKQKQLKQSTVKGTLQINCNGNKVQYYHKDPDDMRIKYIPEKNMKLVIALAQKSYDKKVLRVAEKELNATRRYLAGCPETTIEQVYEDMHVERKKLVVPDIETDEQFVEGWLAEEYEGKEFDYGYPEMFTARNERVRSKSEVIIADMLNNEGIPYKYECPVYLSGYGNVYPDFTVLNVRERRVIYWEHLGLMDQIDYIGANIKKINSYAQNDIVLGDNLIITIETRQNPLDQRFVRKLIEKKLK